MTQSYHAFASSASDDLLIIHTPTDTEKKSKALIDSAAAETFCSDSYAELLTNHSGTHPFRIRLAGGSLSMARNCAHIDFHIGAKINQRISSRVNYLDTTNSY